MSKKTKFNKFIFTLIVFCVLPALVFSFIPGLNLINPSLAAGLDVNSVAQKYGIQSIIVHQVGGNDVASYNATVPPNYPASMAKLIVADVFITTYPDLKNSSLKDSLIQMLSNSSNSDANTLINAVGGLSAVTQKAHQLGYTSTNINDFFSDAGNDPNKTSTVKDISDAMNKIFTQKGQGYIVAQNALKADSNKFGLSSIANKWAGVDGVKQVTGNAALFNVNGTQYIIAMYINKPYTGTDCPAVVAVRNATNDIVNQLKGLSPGSGAGNGVSGATCFILNQAHLPKDFVYPPGCGNNGGGGGNQSVVAIARKYINNPKYTYFSGTPSRNWASDKNPTNFDCSGFGGYAWYWGTNGKVTMWGQTCSDWNDSTGKYQKFMPSQISQIQPGDLVYFTGADPCIGARPGDLQGPGHVVIYEGQGVAPATCDNGNKDCVMEFFNTGQPGKSDSLAAHMKEDHMWGFLRPVIKS